MNLHPTLILVAGGPGAGKTTLGRALVRRIPSAILLDKDVLASPWVDKVLEQLNNGQVDRDSRVYLDVVRPLEYEALMATAIDNLALGRTVVAVAPFGPELRDEEWMFLCRHRAAAAGARMMVIWIETGADLARERMVVRNDARDGWKLAHWNEFARGQPYAAPEAVSVAAPAADTADAAPAPPSETPPTRWLLLHNGPDSRIGDLVERVIQQLEKS